MKTILLLASTVASGLAAGLLFNWSVSIIPGLARLSNADYLSVFQSINRAIQNPVFFLVFFSPILLLPITAWLHYSGTDRGGFWLLAGASALYIVGVFGVTALGNVPLNNRLDVISLPASEAEMAAFRAQFEPTWNRLHHIRTTIAVLAFLLAVLACLRERG